MSMIKTRIHRVQKLKTYFYGTKRQAHGRTEMFQYLAEHSLRREELRIDLTSDILPLLARLYTRRNGPESQAEITWYELNAPWKMHREILKQTKNLDQARIFIDFDDEVGPDSRAAVEILREFPSVSEVGVITEYHEGDWDAGYDSGNALISQLTIPSPTGTAVLVPQLFSDFKATVTLTMHG
ncbi:hypothetical protein DFH09DRAFT_1086198 [Mycena vulgaris]|nr:hypothetical protein DFH09DRAFT_1086198 [Mycena vulgaris]